MGGHCINRSLSKMVAAHGGSHALARRLQPSEHAAAGGFSSRIENQLLNEKFTLIFLPFNVMVICWVK